MIKRDPKENFFGIYYICLEFSCLVGFVMGKRKKKNQKRDSIPNWSNSEIDTVYMYYNKIYTIN